MKREKIITIIEQTPPANHVFPDAKVADCSRVSKPEPSVMKTGMSHMSVNAASTAGFFSPALKSSTEQRARDKSGAGSRSSEADRQSTAPYPSQSLQAKGVQADQAQAVSTRQQSLVLPTQQTFPVEPEPRRPAPDSVPTYTIKAMPWHNGEYRALKAVGLYQSNQSLPEAGQNGLVETLPRINERV